MLRQTSPVNSYCTGLSSLAECLASLKKAFFMVMASLGDCYKGSCALAFRVHPLEVCRDRSWFGQFVSPQIQARMWSRYGTWHVFKIVFWGSVAREPPCRCVGRVRLAHGAGDHEARTAKRPRGCHGSKCYHGSVLERGRDRGWCQLVVRCRAQVQRLTADTTAYTLRLPRHDGSRCRTTQQTGYCRFVIAECVCKLEKFRLSSLWES